MRARRAWLACQRKLPKLLCFRAWVRRTLSPRTVGWYSDSASMSSATPVQEKVHLRPTSPLVSAVESSSSMPSTGYPTGSISTNTTRPYWKREYERRRRVMPGSSRGATQPSHSAFFGNGYKPLCGWICPCLSSLFGLFAGHTVDFATENCCGAPTTKTSGITSRSGALTLSCTGR